MILHACRIITIENILNKESDSNFLFFDHRAIEQGLGTYAS